MVDIESEMCDYLHVHHNMYVIRCVWYIPLRLKNKCSNLAESGDDFVAGTHPDRDPEQASGLLSVFITGDKSPATRWAVSV